MSLNYKTIIAFSAALIASVTCSIATNASENSTTLLDADYIAGELLNWYSDFFTGASIITNSEEPVMAFSACASNEDIALMLASAALSTHDKANIISSNERLSNDGSYELEVKSKTSSLQLNYVVLRTDKIRSAPPEICVLITKE